MKRKALRTVSLSVVLSLLVSLLPLTVFAGDIEPIEKIYSSQELEKIYGNEVLASPSAVDVSTIPTIEVATISVDDVTLDEFMQQNMTSKNVAGWFNDQDEWYYLTNTGEPIAYHTLGCYWWRRIFL